MVPTRTAIRFNLSTRRIRGGVIATFAIVAGVTAGLAAAAGSGPFAGLRPHLTYAQVRSHASQSPTRADVLFPAPTPQVINNVVSVVDPAPPASMDTSAPERDDNGASASGDQEHAPATTGSDDHAPAAQLSPQPSPGGGD